MKAPSPLDSTNDAREMALAMRAVHVSVWLGFDRVCGNGVRCWIEAFAMPEAAGRLE